MPGHIEAGLLIDEEGGHVTVGFRQLIRSGSARR